MSAQNLHKFGRFCDAIRRAVGNSGSSQIGSILDIGFGSIWELVALQTVFPGSKIIAVDANPLVIERAEKHHKSLPLVQAKIVNVDARRLRRSIITQSDLIIFRHPNVEDLQAGWVDILRRIARHMRRNSTLFLSTYSISELEFADKHFECCSMEPIPGSPYSDYSVELDGTDRHSAAYVRR